MFPKCLFSFLFFSFFLLETTTAHPEHSNTLEQKMLTQLSTQTTAQEGACVCPHMTLLRPPSVQSHSPTSPSKYDVWWSAPHPGRRTASTVRSGLRADGVKARPFPQARQERVMMEMEQSAQREGEVRQFRGPRGFRGVSSFHSSARAGSPILRSPPFNWALLRRRPC